jgi:hypothetical protein
MPDAVPTTMPAASSAATNDLFMAFSTSAAIGYHNPAAGYKFR